MENRNVARISYGGGTHSTTIMTYNQWVCHSPIMSFILLSDPMAHTRNTTKQDLTRKTATHTSRHRNQHRDAYQPCFLKQIFIGQVNETCHNKNLQQVISTTIQSLQKQQGNILYTHINQCIQNIYKGTKDIVRSEERRVGKECRLQCRSRWSPYH